MTTVSLEVLTNRTAVDETFPNQPPREKKEDESHVYPHGTVPDLHSSRERILDSAAVPPEPGGLSGACQRGRQHRGDAGDPVFGTGRHRDQPHAQLAWSGAGEPQSERLVPKKGGVDGTPVPLPRV